MQQRAVAILHSVLEAPLRWCLVLSTGVVASVSAWVLTQRKRRVETWVRLRRLGWLWWPNKVLYIPVMAYTAYMSARYGSICYATAANDCAAGIGYEDKALILEELRQVAPKFVPKDILLKPSDSLETRLQLIGSLGTGYPVYLKPDNGQRGINVARVNSEEEARKYLEASSGVIIAQELLRGIEFGVRYRKRPWEPNGEITSIVRKELPCVVGDGKSTVEDLIIANPYLLDQLFVYRAENGDNVMRSVPGLGQKVQIAHIGNRARGCIFWDSRDLVTPELKKAFDSICLAYDGFGVGRFDVIASDVAAMKRGEFRIVELNGLLAVPEHIFDPSKGTLIGAYKSLFAKVRDAFEIGYHNHVHRNAVMIPAWELIASLRTAANDEVSETHCRLRALERREKKES